MQLFTCTRLNHHQFSAFLTLLRACARVTLASECVCALPLLALLRNTPECTGDTHLTLAYSICTHTHTLSLLCTRANCPLFNSSGGGGPISYNQSLCVGRVSANESTLKRATRCVLICAPDFCVCVRRAQHSIYARSKLRARSLAKTNFPSYNISLTHTQKD